MLRGDIQKKRTEDDKSNRLLLKTYDSVKRETMVEILKELKMDCKITDFIVNYYTGRTAQRYS